jgi:hypothetical protein
VAVRSKAADVFVRSNTGIVGSILSRGMDVCLCLFCVYVVLCRQRPCNELIPRPRSLTHCLQDSNLRIKSEWAQAREPNTSK